MRILKIERAAKNSTVNSDRLKRVKTGGKRGAGKQGFEP
jgi:hypothetical protein